MQKSLLILIVCFIPFTSFATKNLKTVKQKASYGLGVEFSKNLTRQGIDIDVNSFVLGVKDNAKKKSLKLTPEQITKAMQDFKKQIDKKNKLAYDLKAKENLQKEKKFLAKNKKKRGVKTLSSGLQYKILTSGKGKNHPTNDSYVTAHYEGRLINGKVFDSSYKRGKPLEFKLNTIIKGWQEAIKLMTTGDKWEIYVPAKLAYGKKGAGKKIGPNETLIFKIELIVINKNKPNKK